jgi:ubiquinone/menaquinone biosynthesis C-methylase UbiE
MESDLDVIEKELRQSYTKEAVDYDRTRFQTECGNFFNKQQIQLLQQYLPVPSTIHMLDLATGTGRIAVELALGRKIVALDITPNMLKIARAKASKQNLDYIQFIVASARQLPFRDGTFDCLTSIRFIHVLPRKKYPAFIREMIRVLRKDGTLMLGLDNPLFYGIIFGILKQILHRKFILKKKPTSYLWPHQIKSSLEGMTHLRVIGFWLPGLANIRRIHEKTAYMLSRLCQKFPFNFLSSPIVVVAKKE